MGTKHVRTLVVFTSAALLMFVGNAAEAQKAKNKVITLLSPAANVVVAQNDTATGCPATPTHPYGYMINFSWSDSPLRNGSTYTVQIQHAGSPFPSVVGEGLTTSTYAFVDCNSFIIDPNLSNWSWEVIRVRGNGAVARVSAQRSFSFGPCRVSGGGACVSLP